MNFLRNFLSTIFSSLLVLVVGFLIIIVSITSVVFDQKFILGTLEKNNTYKVLSTEIIPQVLTYALTSEFQQEVPDQNIADQITSEMDKSAFEQLSPELQKVVESSYSFVIGETDNFAVQIQFGKYIPVLQTNLENAVSNLQSKGQIQGFDIKEVTDNLQEGKDASILITAEKIEVTGLQELNQNQQPSADMKKSILYQLRDTLEKIRQTQTLLIVAAVFLYILLFLSRIPHFLSGLKWVSTTTLSAAIFPLVVGFLLFVIKPVGIITKFIKEQDGVGNFSVAVDLASKNLEVITEKIFLNILTFSGVLTATAALLYVAVFFLTRAKNRHDRETLTE